MAQLGARFHGMEEVKGSNPFRSTKTFSILSVLGPQKSSPSDFKLHLMPLLSGYKLNRFNCLENASKFSWESSY